MLRQSLHQAAWSVRAVGELDGVPRGARRALPAVVPGCVHLDLIRAGVIGDPALGDNELRQFWVGRNDWEYRCTFIARGAMFKHERIDLVCDGLDTVCAVELNGEAVGDAANMFHPHRFDVRGALRRGENELVIRFRSPLRHIRAEEARLGTRPVNGDWDPYIFIRKAACNFGWDWGPKVPTVGVWRGIGLEGWSGARIAVVRPLVTRAAAVKAQIDVWVDVERASQVKGLLADVELVAPGGAEFRRTKQIGGGEAGFASHVVRMTVERPELWWPRGHGGQPLYSLAVSLRTGEKTVDSTKRRIGLRSAKLNTSRDKHGSKFQIEINGKPIFCRGANWIPDGLFPTGIKPAQIRKRVRQAAAAKMNMLRVWGGGYYEDEAFYDECDRKGVMVWQDFMFSCAMYPEEDPYPKLIEAEARHNVARLSSHPSIVLWCGGNECVWGWQKWGWKERLKPGQSWGAMYYVDLLPRVVREVDPTTPYWANSPWSGSLDHDVLDENHGDRHTWDAQFEEYRKTNPRFLSEFGRQAPAKLKTLGEAIAKKDLRVNSKAMAHRQRATGGNAVIYDAALARFGLTPRTFEEWHAVTQGLQSEAMKIAISWSLENEPRCMGVLIWQLNDCWPALSWSLIDSAGREKPAYYEVQKLFGSAEKGRGSPRARSS